MSDVINNLTTQLGIDENQAECGVGILLNYARQTLPGGDFTKVEEAFGGSAGTFISKAPTGVGVTGGTPGTPGGTTGGVGNAGYVTGGFQTLNIDPSTIVRFIPIVVDYVKSKGGDTVAGTFQGIFK